MHQYILYSSPEKSNDMISIQETRPLMHISMSTYNSHQDLSHHVTEQRLKLQSICHFFIYGRIIVDYEIVLMLTCKKKLKTD